MDSKKASVYYQTALPNKLSSIKEDMLNNEERYQSILETLSRMEIKLDVLLKMQNQGK